MPFSHLSHQQAVAMTVLTVQRSAAGPLGGDDDPTSSAPLARALLAFEAEIEAGEA